MQDQERKISINFKVKSQGHELTIYLECFSTYMFNILYIDKRCREDILGSGSSATKVTAIVTSPGRALSDFVSGIVLSIKIKVTRSLTLVSFEI